MPTDQQTSILTYLIEFADYFFNTQSKTQPSNTDSSEHHKSSSHSKSRQDKSKSHQHQSQPHHSEHQPSDSKHTLDSSRHEFGSRSHGAGRTGQDGTAQADPSQPDEDVTILPEKLTFDANNNLIQPQHLSIIANEQDSIIHYTLNPEKHQPLKTIPSGTNQRKINNYTNTNRNSNLPENDGPSDPNSTLDANTRRSKRRAPGIPIDEKNLKNMSENQIKNANLTDLVTGSKTLSTMMVESCKSIETLYEKTALEAKENFGHLQVGVDDEDEKGQMQNSQNSGAGQNSILPAIAKSKTVNVSDTAASRLMNQLSESKTSSSSFNDKSGNFRTIVPSPKNVQKIRIQTDKEEELNKMLTQLEEHPNSGKVHYHGEPRRQGTFTIGGDLEATIKIG